MRTPRFLVPALLAMVGLASAQDFGALSSCAQNCVNNMRTSVGCVPVTDQCLCGNAAFENGIRDCANQACSAEDAAAAVDFAGGFCLKATGTTAAAPETTPETTATPPPPPTTTAESETTTTPTTATEPTSVSAETTTSGPETPTASVATTQTSSTASSTASETTATSPTSSASKTTSKTTAGTEASATESASSTADAAAAGSSDSGLSVGAKAGLAVGVGAAVVAIVAFAVAYCQTRRSRRPIPRGTMQISEPLPGSGRLDDYESGTQFTTRPPKSAGANSKFSQMTELDQNARRYEDMLPRVSPRRMV